MPGRTMQEGLSLERQLAGHRSGDKSKVVTRTRLKLITDLYSGPRHSSGNLYKTCAFSLPQAAAAWIQA